MTRLTVMTVAGSLLLNAMSGSAWGSGYNLVVKTEGNPGVVSKTPEALDHNDFAITPEEAKNSKEKSQTARQRLADWWKFIPTVLNAMGIIVAGEMILRNRSGSAPANQPDMPSSGVKKDPPAAGNIGRTLSQASMGSTGSNSTDVDTKLQKTIAQTPPMDPEALVQQFTKASMEAQRKSSDNNNALASPSKDGKQEELETITNSKQELDKIKDMLKAITYKKAPLLTSKDGKQRISQKSGLSSKGVAEAVEKEQEKKEKEKAKKKEKNLQTCKEQLIDKLTKLADPSKNYFGEDKNITKDKKLIGFEKWFKEVKELLNQMKLSSDQYIQLKGLVRDYIQAVRHETPNPIEWNEKVVKNHPTYKAHMLVKRLGVSGGLPEKNEYVHILLKEKGYKEIEQEIKSMTDVDYLRLESAWQYVSGLKRIPNGINYQEKPRFYLEAITSELLKDSFFAKDKDFYEGTKKIVGKFIQPKSTGIKLNECAYEFHKEIYTLDEKVLKKYLDKSISPSGWGEAAGYLKDYSRLVEGMNRLHPDWSYHSPLSISGTFEPVPTTLKGLATALTKTRLSQAFQDASIKSFQQHKAYKFKETDFDKPGFYAVLSDNNNIMSPQLFIKDK